MTIQQPPGEPLAHIDLAALRHNVAVARACAPKARLLAFVKANAYGHGILQVARALAPLADGLAVARLSEALELREQRIPGRIVVFNAPAGQDTLHCCSEHNLDLVIHETENARLLCSTALPRPLRVWLKLDSGMHRLGLDAKQFNEALPLLQHSPTVSEVIALTHFAAADEPELQSARQQLQAMNDVLKEAAVPLSAANSAAVLQFAESRLDWIRPGLMLYGVNPLDSKPHPQLRPVMHLQAPLLTVRDVPPGDRVGYCGLWAAPARRGARVGTVALGYGDGYPMQKEGARTQVRLRGRLLPLVGRVSMDLCAVDLSDCPEAQIGDMVSFWGDGELAVETVAESAGTIPYTLLSNLSSRVRRVYSD